MRSFFFFQSQQAAPYQQPAPETKYVCGGVVDLYNHMLTPNEVRKWAMDQIDEKTQYEIMESFREEQ